MGCSIIKSVVVVGCVPVVYCLPDAVDFDIYYVCRVWNRLEAMKEKAKERARQEELTQGDNAKVDGEDESEEAVEGDSAVTTGSELLTRAERRPRRVASAELSES